jgi:hypothetical protein
MRYSTFEYIPALIKQTWFNYRQSGHLLCLILRTLQCVQFQSSYTAIAWNMNLFQSIRHFPYLEIMDSLILCLRRTHIVSYSVFCEYAQFHFLVMVTRPHYHECAKWHWKFPEPLRDWTQYQQGINPSLLSFLKTKSFFAFSLLGNIQNRLLIKISPRFGFIGMNQEPRWLLLSMKKNRPCKWTCYVYNGKGWDDFWTLQQLQSDFLDYFAHNCKALSGLSKKETHQNNCFLAAKETPPVRTGIVLAPKTPSVTTTVLGPTRLLIAVTWPVLDLGTIRYVPRKSQTARVWGCGHAAPGRLHLRRRRQRNGTWAGGSPHETCC